MPTLCHGSFGILPTNCGQCENHRPILALLPCCAFVQAARLGSATTWVHGFDEAEFAEHGWHSDVERLSEESLYGFVQFMWYAVVGIAASK